MKTCATDVFNFIVNCYLTVILWLVMLSLVGCCTFLSLCKASRVNNPKHRPHNFAQKYVTLGLQIISPNVCCVDFSKPPARSNSILLCLWLHAVSVKFVFPNIF